MAGICVFFSFLVFLWDRTIAGRRASFPALHCSSSLVSGNFSGVRQRFFFDMVRGLNWLDIPFALLGSSGGCTAEVADSEQHFYNLTAFDDMSFRSYLRICKCGSSSPADACDTVGNWTKHPGHLDSTCQIALHRAARCSSTTREAEVTESLLIRGRARLPSHAPPGCLVRIILPFFVIYCFAGVLCSEESSGQNTLLPF